MINISKIVKQWGLLLWCNQWWYVEERSRDTDLNNVIKGSTGPKQDTKHYQPTSS